MIVVIGGDRGKRGRLARGMLYTADAGISAMAVIGGLLTLVTPGKIGDAIMEQPHPAVVHAVLHIAAACIIAAAILLTPSAPTPDLRPRARMSYGSRARHCSPSYSSARLRTRLRVGPGIAGLLPDRQYRDPGLHRAGRVMVFAMGIGSLSAKPSSDGRSRGLPPLNSRWQLLGGLSVMALYAAFAYYPSTPRHWSSSRSSWACSSARRSCC